MDYTASKYVSVFARLLTDWVKDYILYQEQDVK